MRMCMGMIRIYFNFWRIKLTRQCLWIQGYSEWIASSRNRGLWFWEDSKIVRAHFPLALRCNKPFSVSDRVYSRLPSDWTWIVNRSTVALKSQNKYKFLKGIPWIHHFFFMAISYSFIMHHSLYMHFPIKSETKSTLFTRH